MATGDLNGDGVSDLSVANEGSASGTGSLTVALSQPASAALRVVPAGRLVGRRSRSGFTARGTLSFGAYDFGTPSFTSDGAVHATGAMASGRLTARLVGGRGARRGAPAGLREALNGTFVGSFSAARYPSADGLGPIVVSAIVVGRSARDPKTVACLRVEVDGRPGQAASNRLTVLGATGKASGLRATGTFAAPQLSDLPGLGKVALRVTRGRPRALRGTCARLLRQLR